MRTRTEHALTRQGARSQIDFGEGGGGGGDFRSG
jgi:hypothetical protein